MNVVRHCTLFEVLYSLKRNNYTITDKLIRDLNKVLFGDDRLEETDIKILIKAFA